MGYDFLDNLAMLLSIISPTITIIAIGLVILGIILNATLLSIKDRAMFYSDENNKTILEEY